jgi:hypothetical protein
MLSRQMPTVKRLVRHVGIAHLRVPAVHVEYVGPFAKYSKFCVPFLRIPTVKVEVYRPFR